MTEQPHFLAVDLGASSGRVMAGTWDGTRFLLRELHRFANGPVAVQGRLYWDVLRLWDEIQTGLARHAGEGHAPPAAIGIDTWAVDFALLDGAGRLLGNPYHYRDRRTTGLPEWVDSRVAPARLFAQTGIQRLPINTLYQWASMRQSNDPQLAAAATLLLIPDLFHYWLTGQRVAEYTNATTSQFYDAQTGTWAYDLLAALDLPAAILPPVVAPGTRLGDLLPEVRERLGLRGPVPVIATATHDTASAVAAVPDLDAASVYISSGTWSLVGVETAQPILTEQAWRWNFTNEGGVGGTIRLLKNVGGLWLLQECRRHWEQAGHAYSWAALVAQAAAAPPLQSLVDPDAPEFLNPRDMSLTIRAYWPPYRAGRTHHARRAGTLLPGKSGPEIPLGGTGAGNVSRPPSNHDPHRRRRQPEYAAVPAYRRCLRAARSSPALLRPPRWAISWCRRWRPAICPISPPGGGRWRPRTAGSISRPQPSAAWDAAIRRFAALPTISPL